MQLKRNKEMEFETLKKSHKKQLIIGALAVCVIGGTLTFNLTRAKYKITEEIPLVKGNVNYSVPDMRVVAVKLSEDGTNYTEANDIPKSGYTLNNAKSVCKVYDGTTSIEDAPKDNNVTIEYHDGAIGIDNLSKKNTRCYLYFDKKTTITMDNLIESLPVKVGSPDFSQIATTDEGVYSVADGMYGGTSYYWRGAATTNYVKFAGFCWRIVRINGDKTMRLIYDGTTCHANGTSTEENIAVKSVEYNINVNQSNYVGWAYEGQLQRPNDNVTAIASNAKTQLETWYNANIIGANATKVAQGKYCNDRNVQSGNTWAISGNMFNYAAYKRIWTDHSPSLSCPNGDEYTLSVGLITVDEAMYAGGTDTNNSSYYLYSGQSYWTMSAYWWDGSYAWVFVVRYDGFLNASYVSNTWGLRPVINLKSDTLFKLGTDGTLNNPYVVQ